MVGRTSRPMSKMRLQSKILRCAALLVIAGCAPNVHSAGIRGAGYVRVAEVVKHHPLYPQLSQLDDAIAAIKLPKCVASSGTPEKIRHGLSCAGLYEQLAPHIFSATQVKRGKPAPDLFLFAAEQMKARPERCLVIEDSVHGVTAARRAEMVVFGFTGGAHAQGREYNARLVEAGAAVVFDDMRELPRLVNDWRRSFLQRSAS